MGFLFPLALAGSIGWNISITISQNASAGMPSTRRAASNEISSDSAQEVLIEPCFLQNQDIGTKVCGPMSTKKHPEVLLLSPSHAANEASANSRKRQPFGSSPTQHCISNSE